MARFARGPWWGTRGRRAFFVSMTGMVWETGGGVYRVALDARQDDDAVRIVDASLRGRLKLEQRAGDQVVIGDRVRVVEADDGGFTVEEVFPRERELLRRGGPGGRKARVVAANVDRMAVVVAAVNPEPKRALIDRLLVIGEASEVECVLVINKVDLSGGAESAALLGGTYRDVGYTVLEASAATGVGLEEFRGILSSGISAFVGPSGAGKSSLLNALEPGLGLRTGELSRKRGTGRHTTVRSRLIPLECGGLVADTPGFADASIWKMHPAELGYCFPDFRLFLEGCRFRECSHLHEPDCAVKEALEEGAIHVSRYESYRSILEEVREESR